MSKPYTDLEFLNAQNSIRYRLDGRGGEDWAVYESDSRSYNQTFKAILGGQTLESIARDISCEHGRPPVVLDVMSTPHAIWSLASKMPVSGVSVSLSEVSVGTVVPPSKVVHVAGDLALPGTYAKILRAMEGQKADMILQRGWGGLSCLPQSARFFEVAFNSLLRLVAPLPTSVMFMQTPFKDNALQMGLPGVEDLAKSLQQQGLNICHAPDPLRHGDVLKVVGSRAMPQRVKFPGIPL